MYRYACKRSGSMPWANLLPAGKRKGSKAVACFHGLFH